MKILFSPEYSGHVFTQSGVMMDTVVTNTTGLIDLLELRLGLHYEDTLHKSVLLIIMMQSASIWMLIPKM